MKKIIIYILSGFALLTALTSCEDRLDVKPSSQISGDGIMDNASTALMTINGLYRYMFEFGQTTTANYHQSFGPQSYVLTADVMGDDLIMGAQGSGWFWFDHIYNVKSRYTSGGWRSYDIWNYGYTMAANVNYIIAAKETIQGAKDDVDYVVGQAYALRAHAYNELAQYFARTYIGHEDEPGLPIYTEATSAGTPGQSRSSLREVYKLIRDDIDSAVNRLRGTTKQHCSHVDYTVANGFKARICLITNEWGEALTAAQEAQTGYTVGTADDITTGFNDRTKKNVMWAWEIIQSQSTTNPQFFAHLDWQYGRGAYAKTALKLINSELYAYIGSNDVRKNWWYGSGATGTWVNTSGEIEGPGDISYRQNKFHFADPENWMGDRILMRVEEMVLIEAEALCRLGREPEARTALMKLMSKRDPSFDASTLSGTTLATLTHQRTGSLLDEIIMQRRIELWGEVGRLYDIRRLKQGFVRTEAQGFTAAAVAATNNNLCNDPETYGWVLTIPQAEFDGNDNMDPVNDQNPIGPTK